MGTDGAGVMFRRLDSEERVWLMADYAYVTAIAAKRSAKAVERPSGGPVSSYQLRRTRSSPASRPAVPS